MLPYFSTTDVVAALRHGSAAEARSARECVEAVSEAMRDAAIYDHFAAFGYLRSWLTTVATA